MEVSSVKFICYVKRQTLYEVLHSAKVKDAVTREWSDCIVYREVGKPQSQVYVRTLNMFNADEFEFYNS